jgi:hypothetical protein
MTSLIRTHLNISRRIPRQPAQTCTLGPLANLRRIQDTKPLLRNIPEPESAPKKWHISTGCKDTKKAREWSNVNHKKCIEEGVACVNASSSVWDEMKADNDFREKGIRRRAGGNSRTNQVKKFKEKAKKGDKVFLSCCGEVTHVGFWTGEIEKAIPYEYAPGEVAYDLSKQACQRWWADTWDSGKYPTLDEGHYLRVEKWIKLPRSHKGAGRNATLYEVTEKLLNKVTSPDSVPMYV